MELCGDKMNFIPYEKLSKKEQKKINNKKRSDSFGVNMTTKVILDKTKYNRKKNKNIMEAYE